MAINFDFEQFKKLMKIIIRSDSVTPVISKGFLWVNTNKGCFSPDEIKKMLENYYKKDIENIFVKRKIYILFKR